MVEIPLKRFATRNALLSSILALSLGIGACAGPTTQHVEVDDAQVASEARKQREIAFRSLMEDQNRLHDVSFPILTGAVALCGEEIRPAVGLYFANLSFFQEDYREAAASLYGLGASPQIIHVSSGSPAERGGLQAGDVMIAIGGTAVPEGDKAIAAITATWEKAVRPGKPTVFTVLRGGSEVQMEVTSLKACDYPVLAVTSSAVNAFADGEKIGITRGMLRFARDDQELSLVISHELAHNIMKHISAQKQNALFGSILDILASTVIGVSTGGIFGNVAAQAYSKAFEAEADYVGLYIMTTAGLEINDAPYFWRRMAAEHPGNIKANHASTHPATPERFVALEKTIEEIERKRSAGEPLVPSLKKR
jgi:hypothetical protein